MRCSCGPSAGSLRRSVVRLTVGKHGWQGWLADGRRVWILNPPPAPLRPPPRTAAQWNLPNQAGDPAIACCGGEDDREELDGPPPDRWSSDKESLDESAPDRCRDNREAQDGLPPVVSGARTAVVSAAPLHDVDALEARLDARFAARHADFTAFEVSAENGFSRFWQAMVDRATSPHPPASHGLGAAAQS